MERPVERLTRIIDGLNERVARVTFWLMLLVVLVAAFNTLARAAGRRLGMSLGSNALLELQWYLFGAIFLLAGAYTLKRDAHVRVDVLLDRVGPRWKRRIDIAGHALLLLPFMLFGVWVSLEPVAESWRLLETSPDPGGLPRYPLKTLIPVAFALIALQGVSELIKRLREDPDEADRAGLAPVEVAPPSATSPPEAAVDEDAADPDAAHASDGEAPGEAAP